MADEFVSIDSFLQDLTREGQLDSAGSFTLSMEHAREKLSQYLLESTEEYLLKLIQSGVAAGASEMQMHSTTTRVQFTMKGCNFEPRDLSEILNHLLQSGAGAQARALRHLATAVNTAVATRATGIVLATWDGQRGQRMEWRAQGKQVAPWNLGSAVGPCFYFEVRRTGLEFFANFFHLLSQRDILSMLIGTREGMDPDRLMVMDRAAWCPVPLALNGRWLSKPSLGPNEGATFGYSNRPHTMQFRWLGLEQPDDPGVRNFKRTTFDWPWTRNYLQPQLGVVSTGVQPAFDSLRSAVHWVVDGVLVGSDPIEGVRMGSFAWAVASAHGATLDLTGLKVIANPALQQRKQLVTELAWDLLGSRPSEPLPPVDSTSEPLSPAAAPPRRATWEEVRQRRRQQREDQS